MANKPGPTTALNKELLGKIRGYIGDGKTLKETAELCEISINTMYTWHSDNYLNLADRVATWKLDCKLNKADRNINKILDLKVGKEHTKVVADMSKFVKETLDKKNYSKRTETDLTSKGEKIEGFNFILNDSKHKTNAETGTSLEEATG